MSEVAVSREVGAPVADVWRLLTDLPGRAGWLTAVTGVQVATRGGFDVGAVWRETRTAGDGERVVEEFRVAECAAPHRFVLAEPGVGAEYRTTYTLTPARGGAATTVTVVQRGGPTAGPGKLLALVLGGLAARVLEGTLRRDLDDLAAAVGRPAAAA